MTESTTTNSATKSGQALEKLRAFGYAFNDAGQLRKIDESTGEPGEQPFVFEISQDHNKNQEHYEKLADQIPEIVYDLLEKQGLSRTYVPDTVSADQATFIFTQPVQLKNSKKLLVIIHGSGFVRAGQWARSLIINNSIDHGTIIPYIKRAQSLGYDVLVTNTNDNYRVVDGKRKSIPGNSTPVEHAAYVWEKYVMASDPQAVAIVAHSFGGIVAIEMARQFTEFFKKKVFAVALTDSVHNDAVMNSALRKFIPEITCNWISSSKPLDEPVRSTALVPNVSAGHPKHEWTSYSAFDSVFKFLENKYEKFSEAQTD